MSFNGNLRNVHMYQCNTVLEPLKYGSGNGPVQHGSGKWTSAIRFWNQCNTVLKMDQSNTVLEPMQYGSGNGPVQYGSGTNAI